MRTSGAWPLLGTRFVHCKGQQPLIDTAWAQPEASKGHRVGALSFWMHRDIPVDLIDVFLRWQH